MKKMIILLLSIGFLFTQYNLREEVISRHDNGNKKLLVKYQGQGSNEIMVERINYDEDDKIISIEKILENSKIEFSYNPDNELIGKKSYTNGEIETEISIIKEKMYKIEFDVLNNQILNVWDHNNIQQVYNGNGIVQLYYENGQLSVFGYILNGKEDGKFILYYENGQIREEGNYKEGKNEDGKYIEYYENGKIAREGNYKDGEKTGIWTSFSEDGEIIKEINYDELVPEDSNLDEE